MPCHAAMLEALLDGMTIGDADKILFVDLLPNRLGTNCCFFPKQVVRAGGW